MINSPPYTPDGYLDIPRIAQESRATPFIFIIGARQVGKTYGVIQYYYTQNPCGRLLWLRRTDDDRKAMSGAENPFIADGLPIKPLKVAAEGGATNFYRDDAKTKCFASCFALSTMGKIRGLSFPWADTIVFDEFIAPITARPIKNEQTALWDFYTTVAGNRELQGLPALKLWALANANDIGAPVLAGAGLSNVVANMVKSGKSVWICPQRGVSVYIVSSTPINDLQAKHNALYKLLQGGQYADMALKAAFSYNSADGIRTQNITEYRAYCNIGDITVWIHKSKRRIYVCKRTGPAARDYPDNESGRKAAYYALCAKILPFNLVDGRQVFFADYISKKKYHQVVKITEK